MKEKPKLYTCMRCHGGHCVIEAWTIPFACPCMIYKPKWREWNKDEYHKDGETNALFEAGCRITTELSGHTGLT